MNNEDNKKQANQDVMAGAMAWLKTAEGKPPVIASENTQRRHDSEWQNITVIRKDDKEGLRKALEERRAFFAKYGIKQE